MNDNCKNMTREEVIEELADNKRHDLEDAIDGQAMDYQADLDCMTEEELAKEFDNAFGFTIQIVSQETPGE